MKTLRVLGRGSSINVRKVLRACHGSPIARPGQLLQREGFRRFGANPLLGP